MTGLFIWLKLHHWYRAKDIIGANEAIRSGEKPHNREGPQRVKMGHQEIVGVLRESVVLCRAFGVDLQRTSREQGC